MGTCGCCYGYGAVVMGTGVTVSSLDSTRIHCVVFVMEATYDVTVERKRFIPRVRQPVNNKTVSIYHIHACIPNQLTMLYLTANFDYCLTCKLTL